MRIFALLFLTLFAALSAFSQAGDTTFTVLNNRLKMTAPNLNLEVFSKGNLMGPEPSEEADRYITLADGEEKLTIYVNELFVGVNANIKEEIKANIQSWNGNGFTFELTETLSEPGDPFKINVISPNKTVPNNVFLSLFIENFDKTLISMGFYLNQAAYDNDEKWVDITEKIVSSLEPGSRRLERKTPVTMKTLTGDLTITPQPGFGVLAKEGNGMFVTEFYKLTPLSTNPSRFTVYSGMHPSEMLTQPNVPASDIKKRTITLDGEKLKFKTVSEDGLYVAECLSKRTGMAYLHLILVAYDEGIMEEMVKMVEGMKWE